jgi:ammonium transporter, Amt family
VWALLVLKYNLRMYLRVSDDAEILGLDLDQLFDEDVGDWSLFNHLSSVEQGKSPSTPSQDSKSQKIIHLSITN